MTSWHEDLRDSYRPDVVHLLLIGESAPDSTDEDQRFFYKDPLTQHDNLYRGVIEALYCEKPGRKGDSKLPWLERLGGDGVFLIDLCPEPVNKLQHGRSKARRSHASRCVDDAAALEPGGVIVCHAPTYRVLARALRSRELPLLHHEPLPFPSGNCREAFIAGVRDALRPTRLGFGRCG